MHILYPRLAVLVLGLTLIITGLTTSHTEPQPIATPTGLPLVEFYREERYLLDLVSTASPKDAMAYLRQTSAAHPDIAGSCHALAHSIGQAGYQKYGSLAKALEFNDEFCNSGYIHGVMESHIQSIEDLHATLATTCKEYTEHSYRGWQCFHGLGHGVMLNLNNDLPKAIDICLTLATGFGKGNCLNGAFMENFNTEHSAHPSAYRKASDPAYPCSGASDVLQPSCFYYAASYFLSLHQQDYQAGFRWCDSQDRAGRSSCISGIGAVLMKNTLDNPRAAAETCNQAGSQRLPACTRGMLRLLAHHHGSVAPVRSLCGELPEKQRKICEDVVADLEPTFLR